MHRFARTILDTDVLVILRLCGPCLFGIARMHRAVLNTSVVGFLVCSRFNMGIIFRLTYSPVQHSIQRKEF